MTQALLLAMIETYGDIRYVEHALKVYGYTHAIAGAEGLTGEDLLALECAAVLHDIGIPQAIRLHGTGAGPFQEKEGAVVSRPLFEAAGLSGAVLERAVWLVGHHHTKELAKEDHLLQILMEADYLVNLSQSPGREDPKEVLESFFVTASGKSCLETLFLTKQAGQA